MTASWRHCLLLPLLMLLVNLLGCRAQSTLLPQSSSRLDANATLAAIVDEQPVAPHAVTLMPPQRKLSRGKRFVAFPVGSSASAAVCLTTGVIGNPNLLYLSLGLNWGIAYNLPNITWVLHQLHGWGIKKKTMVTQIKRRHRRELYGRLETMINSVVSNATATNANKTSNTTTSSNDAAILDIFMCNTGNNKTADVAAVAAAAAAFSQMGNVSNDLWPSTLMTMMERANMPKTTTVTPTTMAATTTMTSKLCQHAEQSVANSTTLRQHWQRLLRRPKRYLSFPEGSSFSVAVCITVGIIGNPNYAYNSFGLNWGVAYDLPNITWVLNHLHGFSQHPVAPAVLRRRTRRALYKNIEIIIDNMGYNGRDCILRTLCESSQYFQRNKMSMVGEMLRVIFSLPKQRLYTRELHEDDSIQHYDHAYRNAQSADCARQYDCRFSLLELAFGKYTTPPKNYYAQ